MHFGDVSAAIEASGTYEAPRQAHSEQALLAYTDRMHKIIADWDLEGCHKWVPLIDGKQVCLTDCTLGTRMCLVAVFVLHLYCTLKHVAVQIVSLLALSRPGPVVGKMTVLARRWQYAHVERHAKSQKGPVPAGLEKYLQQQHAQSGL